MPNLEIPGSDFRKYFPDFDFFSRFGTTSCTAGAADYGTVSAPLLTVIVGPASIIDAPFPFWIVTPSGNWENTCGPSGDWVRKGFLRKAKDSVANGSRCSGFKSPIFSRDIQA
ncbi:MAG: hypothetical protein ACM3U2_24160 [Deltaproteobacteria bacterium]